MRSSFNRQWCEDSVREAAILLHNKEQAIRQGPMKTELDQLKSHYELLRKKKNEQRDSKNIK